MGGFCCLDSVLVYLRWVVFGVGFVVVGLRIGFTLGDLDLVWLVFFCVGVLCVGLSVFRFGLLY